MMVSHEAGAALPGGLVPLDIEPAPGRLTLSRGTERLADAVGQALAMSGHEAEPGTPRFALRPAATPIGWEAYLWSDEAAQLLESGSFRVRWGRGEAMLRVGAWSRVRCPALGTRRERLRVRSVTPVVARASSSRPSTRGLLVELARRIRVDAAGLDDVRTLHETSDAGGRWEVMLEAPPLAAWLLRIGATMGLGAHARLGFGVVHVDDVIAESTATPPPARPSAPRQQQRPRARPPRGIEGPWFVTPHAVRRYQERRGPEMTYERARARLILESSAARFVRVDTTGAQIWRSPTGLEMVVGAGTGDRPALMTVVQT